MSAIKFLVGGYSSVITALSFQPPLSGAAGSISYLTQTYAGNSPSWLALHPTNSSILYANNEGASGTVISYVVNKATGALTQKGSVYSGGADPAHLLALKNGNEVYVTNYSGGNGLGLNLNADLTSFAASDPVNTFTGTGPSPRQTSPHPHQVLEYNDELLVPDLGADKVWRLTKSGSSWVISGGIAHPAGSGPRHAVTLNANLYTLHELSNTLTQHTIPPLSSTTAPQLITTLPVIPPGASNTTLGAGELLLSPVNNQYPTRYLYATNRNDPNTLGDAIAIFAVSPQLSLVKHVRTGLKHIRGAAIGGPDGKYLFAAGKDGGGIVVYERTNGGADLVEVARTTAVTSPTSFVFL